MGTGEILLIWYKKGNSSAVYFSDRINRMDWINFIPGPDLVLQGRRTRLQSGYLMTIQIDCTQVAPGRACNLV